MDDQAYVIATGLTIVGLVLSRLIRPGFDPFAPVWLFLTGYFQIYVVQATMYRDYALLARGVDVVTAANARACWALLLFLVTYYSGIGKSIARKLPAAPTRWSPELLWFVVPACVLWGLASSYIVLRTWYSIDTISMSPAQRLFFQFPTMQLVGGILLIVTGRQRDRPKPILTVAGIALALSYTLIWMYFGKRSLSLFGVLTTLCAFYIPRYRRPSLATLAGTAFVGCLVVALAIGWRIYKNRGNEVSVSNFTTFVSTFDVSEILMSLNLKEWEDKEHDPSREATSRETEEYGGYLLMVDTVPNKSSYDLGASYLRLVSTYIPRVIWHDKPIYGREKWVSAWIAGSEFPRDETFTGPAIGILGAAQLNGGAVATGIMMVALGLLLRTGYDYFRYHAATPWAQAWWALTYYNAWLMTVNDDPAVWFYYLYGHTTLPPLVFLWFMNRLGGSHSSGRGH